ncbi:ribosylnicotinamide kinase [Gonapodya sp. JEL0774]|nr:ribosylnicotinamide kinase [Gonapodya sp. JEL0774]
MPDGSKLENWDIPEALEMGKFLTSLKALKADPSQGLLQGGTTHSQGGGEPTNPLDPSNLDGSSMTISSSSFRALKERFSVAVLPSSMYFILVDGFLLYHSMELAREFDFRIFLDADYATLKSRRDSRSGYLTSEDTIWKGECSRLNFELTLTPV